MTLDEIRTLVARLGHPVVTGEPESTGRFPDGRRYRIEMPAETRELHLVDIGIAAAEAARAPVPVLDDVMIEQRYGLHAALAF